MLRQITYKQLLGWEAYNELEPFGWHWENYRIASVVKAIYDGLDAVVVRILNAFKGRNSSSLKFNPVKLEDCVLKIEDEEETKKKKKAKGPQTVEEQIAIAKIWAETAAALHRERVTDK